MEHQGTKTIETERLILRKFTADDLSAIFHNWTSESNLIFKMANAQKH